jgi:hypothetical protein
MRNRYRFMRPPKAIRRAQVKLDNVALIPGNLLPFKSAYQKIANGLPKGGILIVLPHELKNKGHRIVTVSAERFA